jgi:hypothetical protein
MTLSASTSFPFFAPQARLRPWLVALGLAAGLAHAEEAAPVPAQASALSFAQARQALVERSDQLAASAKAVESARLRRQGTQGLGGPSVAITGMGYRYSANADIDLDPARRTLDGVLGQLPPSVGPAIPSLPQLPTSYALQRKSTNASASLSLVWPLYRAACPMRCAAAWTRPPTKPWPMPPAAAMPCLRCWCSAISAPSWPNARPGCASAPWTVCARMTRRRKACSRRV